MLLWIAIGGGLTLMMGQHTRSESLFYYFRLEDQVPEGHLLRMIATHIDFSFVREQLKDSYSDTGRASIDPELLLRIVLIGYLYGISSERKLVEELRMHLAWRWFTGLGFDQEIPHHSTFSKNRHGRFHESKLFGQMFERIVGQCLEVGLVRGDKLSVDGTFVEANASKESRIPREQLAEAAQVNRTVRDWLTELDAQNPVMEPTHSQDKVSTTDPDSTYATKGGTPARMGYYNNYLVDNHSCIIVGVQATGARLSEESRAAEKMIARFTQWQGKNPQSIAADASYGNGELLQWLMDRQITPYMPTRDAVARTRSPLFGPERFTYQPESNSYLCPAGQQLNYGGRNDSNRAFAYIGTRPKCGPCPLSLSALFIASPKNEAWLAVAPDGLFDGTSDAMRQVAWRINGNETSSLEAFFTDFYYPGLLGEILSGGNPKAQVDIATALQVPGLRAMLAEKLAHLENREGRVVVCFEQKPGAVVNVGPSDQRIFFPAVNGYSPGASPTCKLEKSLTSGGAASAAPITELQNWKAETVTTPWDGKPSETTHSTLHELAVGISQYPSESGFEPLPYAVPSAKAIEEFFRQQGMNEKKPFAKVRVWPGLYDADASRLKLRQTLSQMGAEVNEDDVVLLYFAGHGKVSVGEEMFYFLPVDGQEADLADTSLSTATIAEALRNLPARRIMLIVDACQSGGAIEALGKIGAVKAQVEQRRSRQESNQAIDRGVGIHLIAATLPLSYAIGLRDGESVLAGALLKDLKEQAGTTTANQLSDYLQHEMPSISESVTRGFRQVPLIESIGLDFPVAAQ